MVIVRPSREQDHAAIVAIGNSTNPDRIQRSVEDFRAAIRRQPPEAAARSYVAELEGQVAGLLWLNRLIYVGSPHVWYTDILVQPSLQGRGIGSRLYALLCDRLEEHRAERVYAGVREDNDLARRFAGKRGFRETGHGDRPSRLGVRTADSERGRQAADRLAREGIRITTLAGLGAADERVLRSMYALITETYADMPRSHDWTSIPFQEWQRLRKESDVRPDMVWLAVDGTRVVGLASLLKHDEHAASAGHTGVARTHRGRGIARALKYRQVEGAREHRIDYLFTENDVENGPMLHINTEMGYRPLPADIELTKDLGGS